MDAGALHAAERLVERHVGAELEHPAQEAAASRLGGGRGSVRLGKVGCVTLRERRQVVAVQHPPHVVRSSAVYDEPRPSGSSELLLHFGDPVIQAHCCHLARRCHHLAHGGGLEAHGPFEHGDVC